jgi:glycogen(starch) synthase
MTHTGDSATQAQEPDRTRTDTAGPCGLRVLRLCSVFEPLGLDRGSAGYDPIGGMQNHTAELTRCLDRMAIHQVVLTSRLDGPAGWTPFGCHAEVVRTGVHMPLFRQAWVLPAAWLAVEDRGPFSVVHAHCGEDMAVLPLARMAAWRHRCPLVVTVHTSVRHTLLVSSARTALLKAAGGLAEQCTLPRADAVIVLTESAAERLRRDGVPESRIRVIPPGYDPELFAEPAPDPFPELPRPRVAYVGRLAPQKDVRTLVAAFGRVPGEACLVIVGDGPDRPAVERRARTLPGGNLRVRFTGFLPHAQVPAVLSHSDVLVLATRYEELGTVLIEGMAAGLPVIASRVGGIPDLVQHEVNGLLVPPGDPDALASAITRVLSQPWTAARLAAGARRTAEAYTWPELARRVAAVYREVAGRAVIPRGRVRAAPPAGA